MELHWVPTSQDGRLVYFFVNAAGVDIFNVQEKTSALCEMPTLKDGETVLQDSAEIIKYLAEKFENSLLPSAETEGYAEILTGFEQVKGSLWAVTKELITVGFTDVVELDQIDPEQIDRLRAEVVSQLKTVESTLFQNSEFAIGTQLSVVDLCLVTALSQLELVELDFTELDKINDLWEKMQDEHSFFISHRSYYRRIRSLSKIYNSKISSKSPSQPIQTSDDLTLYHIPGSRSTRVLWLLHELGLIESTTVTRLNWTDLVRDRYTNINPNQTVPSFESSALDHVLFEAGAIIDYLLDTYPNNLYPSNWTSTNWTRHHMYKFYCIATLDGRLVSKLHSSGAVGNKMNKTGQKIFNNLIEPFLERDLGDNLYINGDEFSATDIMIGYTLYVCSHLNIKFSTSIEAYYERLTDREGFKQSFPSNFSYSPNKKK